jgi:O-antigen/teichoic acid export membrane protein
MRSTPPSLGLRSSGLAAFQVVVTTGILFSVYRLLTHHAGVSGLGLWTTAVSICGISSLADLGLTDLMVRQVAAACGDGDLGRAKGTYRTLSIVGGTSMAIVGLATVPFTEHYLARAATPQLAAYVTWFALTAPTITWLNSVCFGLYGVLEGMGRYDLRLACVMAGGICTLLAAFLMAPVDATLAICVTFLSGAVASFVCALGCNAWILGRVPAIVVRVPVIEALRLMRLGAQVKIAGVLNLALDPVTRILLTRFGGVEATGIYEIAYRIFWQVRSMVVAALQVMVPRLAMQGASDVGASNALVTRFAQLGALMGLPAFMAALLIVPTVGIMVFGSAPHSLAWYSIWLCIGWLINCLAVPAYFANLVQGHMVRNWISQLVIVIANGLIGGIGGLLFHGYGVVAANAFALACGGVTIIGARRQVFLNAMRLFERKHLAVALLGCTLIVFVYTAWIADLSSTFGLVLTSAIAAASFGAVVGGVWIGNYRSIESRTVTIE